MGTAITAGKRDFECIVAIGGDNSDIIYSPCGNCRQMLMDYWPECSGLHLPVCLWEIDLFIQNDYEESDLNHGLTLLEARKKYQHYGAVLPHLKAYCRQHKAEIFKRKDNLYQVFVYYWYDEWETWSENTRGISITDNEESAISSALEHLRNTTGEEIEFYK